MSFSPTSKQQTTKNGYQPYLTHLVYNVTVADLQPYGDVFRRCQGPTFIIAHIQIFFHYHTGLPKFCGESFFTK